MCTTPSHSTGRTPFALLYGAEAILLAEIEHRSFHVEKLREAVSLTCKLNDEICQIELDLNEITHDQALAKHAPYEQSAARLSNTRVRPRTFIQGDLILKKVLDPKMQG